MNCNKVAVEMVTIDLEISKDLLEHASGVFGDSWSSSLIGTFIQDGIDNHMRYLRHYNIDKSNGRAVPG